MQDGHPEERKNEAYLKERMWCIYIQHSSCLLVGAVWICYPNVVRRYGRYVRYTYRGRGPALACGLTLDITKSQRGVGA